MQPVTIQPWFKPHGAFVLDGDRWVTNGYVAMIATVDGADKPLDPNVVGAMLPRAKPPRHMRHDRGYVVLDGIVLNGFLMGLVDAAYPGATWDLGAGDDATSGFAVGRIDGKAVAIVMSMRGPVSEDCKPPTCPVCEGVGGPACEDCEGTGESECSKCGHDSECDTCDGDGYVTKCEACKGRKVWKATTA